MRRIENRIFIRLRIQKREVLFFVDEGFPVSKLMKNPQNGKINTNALQDDLY